MLVQAGTVLSSDMATLYVIGFFISPTEPPMVELLLAQRGRPRIACDYGVNVNTFISDDEKTAVLCAVRFKTVIFVLALLQHGPKPHYCGHSGRTVLYHHAVTYNARSYGSTITARS
ncbi:hypothetical protein FPCIR_1011 [Fusarium pseudocircinatum]|uniref:Uncharacterized protein n=1 Tax=Fusarium pseudocircinatum TaxID=56676 RepID=A0A8H5PW22_9HYPO|nr:hypothetical protein FPCIR_1011 [Fusarium pseudocircinatum]